MSDSVTSDVHIERQNKDMNQLHSLPSPGTWGIRRLEYESRHAGKQFSKETTSSRSGNSSSKAGTAAKRHLQSGELDLVMVN